MRAAHVGLIGCGRWGKNILRDLTSLGARVTVVARSAASRARAEQGGAAAIVDTVAALPEVEAVYIASTISTHAELIDAVAGRRVPIFCEKPLTDDAAWARQVPARIPAGVFVLDKWRYHPGIEAIARIARSGELGPVIGLSTRRLGWGNSHADATATWVLGPHDLSIGLEILGRVLPLRGAVADGNDGRLSGWSAILGDGQAWQTVEISERAVERTRSVQLFCRDGGATLADPYADHVAVWRMRVGDSQAPAEIEQRPISADWPLKIMLAETLRHLDGGPAPRTGVADAVTIVTRLAEIDAACAHQP